MERLNRSIVDKALLEAAFISEEKWDQLLQEQQRTGKPMAGLLKEKGFLDEETAISALQELLDIPRVNLYSYRIEDRVIEAIPADYARRYQVMPVGIRDGSLFLAMADPLDLEALDNAAMLTGREICPVLAEDKAISYAINHYYDMGSSNLAVETKSDNGSIVQEAETKEKALASEEYTPVVRMVNYLIDRALEEGASDIHLEPADEGLRIRMRLDGILHDLAVSHRFKQAQIISRVKIMSNLDIAEKRLAQDGNIHYCSDGRDINLRVSTMPTLHGEKAVIRILDNEKVILPLKSLGFSNANYPAFQRLILNQSGMLLVTGPTGCGKTTTLYSTLNFLNSPRNNIITVEDPVEYRLNGINQVPVNLKINRTFANTLRSILRQDPDIIMVGEIRDLETAKIATQAALTGHLVLSTLHTNNAASAVTRLVDMGIEPFMVTASTVGIVAQRLIRKICPHCIEEYRLGEEDKEFFRQYFKKEPPPALARGAKCKRCNHTGYRGRVPIHELLVLNQELQVLVLRNAPAGELHKKAIELGMRSLLEDGLRLLEKRVSTMGEVVRATFNSLFDERNGEYAKDSTYLDELQKDPR